MEFTTLRAQGVSQIYGSNTAATTALDNVSIEIGASGPEAVAIMGPSGSGKSTLLHALAGIATPTSGNVMWRGVDIASMSDAARTKLRRSAFGFVFQKGQLLPELPAIENVALPMMLGGMPRATAEGRAEQLLQQLGLGFMSKRRPGELSGGQAQRVAIARALVGQPGIVFADEPTGALDQNTGAQVMQMLTQMTLHSGASLVLVTHDPKVAAQCTRIVRLRDGRIISDDQNTPQVPEEEPQVETAGYGDARVQVANQAPWVTQEQHRSPVPAAQYSAAQQYGQHGQTQYGQAQHGQAQYGQAQHGLAQNNRVQYSAPHHGGPQHYGQPQQYSAPAPQQGTIPNPMAPRDHGTWNGQQR
ncbi:ATP-binding cassette domain-containing protein [Humidisolicoccus flavus]|uniref:ABC transporter ATP-binding protein n=1 Tax=Humidisolicoccus flavus TaxID=3111414 RepID=UPI0032443493